MKFLLPSSVGLLGLMVLAGCHSNKPAVEEAPLVVSVAQLKPGKALAYDEFTGRTASISTVDIKARRDRLPGEGPVHRRRRGQGGPAPLRD